MPADLREAHERNDEVLERIYIGRLVKNDTERLEKLFDLYTKMTASAGPKKRKEVVKSPSRATRRAGTRQSHCRNREEEIRRFHPDVRTSRLAGTWLQYDAEGSDPRGPELRQRDSF